MKKVEEIVCDPELVVAVGDANFGGVPIRDILATGVLQTAAGLYTGGTLRAIMRDLGLIGATRRPHAVPHLTKRGKAYLWAAFGQKSF